MKFSQKANFKILYNAPLKNWIFVKKWGLKNWFLAELIWGFGMEILRKFRL